MFIAASLASSNLAKIPVMDGIVTVLQSVSPFQARYKKSSIYSSLEAEGGLVRIDLRV
jgi:hypothetical protein